ncbi:hypothetical protein LWI29_015960 [Acer saccharum]|uniref:RNase H type-1 domain-containing protein n=1 Tax=Acer saccharum TaxID=4024 RepID=A0AA39VC62_ACESA|nr:hypothetical protein LWI29_015960 [Acer saccharum]
MGGNVQVSGGTCWRPLDEDDYKTNCRAIIDNKSGHVGIWIIIRNSCGEVMAYCSQTLEANLSTRIANVMAIQRSLQFGLKCGLTSTNIESDEATVIKWINLGLHRDTDYGMILSDIDVLKADIRGMSFSHIPPLASKAALSLAKNVMSIAEDRFWMDEYLDSIRRIIQAEKPG